MFAFLPPLSAFTALALLGLAEFKGLDALHKWGKAARQIVGYRRLDLGGYQFNLRHSMPRDAHGANLRDK